MSQTDLVRFRRMCGQFRWLAVFMVISIGDLLALTYLVVPAVFVLRDQHPGPVGTWLAEAV